MNTLLPGFVSGANNLHNILLPVCLVLGFAGLVWRCTTMYRERSLQAVWPYMVKMVVTFCALGLLASWGQTIQGAVTEITGQAGLNQSNVLTTFVDDVAKKFGMPVNASGQPATQPVQQQQQTNAVQGALQSAGNTIGNITSWLSWASSIMTPGTAAAKATTSVFGVVANAQTGLQAMFEALFVMICCMLGMLAMWIMWLVQQVLVVAAVAVSPIFLGCLLLPPLGQMAARFFTNFVALCCWPIGWGIANLVTIALLNLALNPSNDAALGAFGAFGGGFVWWIGAGLWALFSSIAAPWLVTKALSAGENPLVSLFSASVNTAQTSISIATAAAAPLTGQATAAGSIVAGTMAVRKSFASRPVSSSSNGSTQAKAS
jgi:hypothetical protein